MNQKFARVMVSINRTMWWVMLATIPVDIFIVFFWLEASKVLPQGRGLATSSLVFAAIKTAWCWLNRAPK